MGQTLKPNVDEWVLRAAKAHAAGHLQEAERLAREVIRLDPGNIQAKLLLGVIAVKTRRPNDAVPHLLQVAQQDPTSFHARLWLSRAYLQLKDLNKALPPARQALQLQPNDQAALAHLALCLVDLNHFDEAQPLLERALQQDPKAAVLQQALARVKETSLARTLLDQGKAAEALEQIEIADPTRPNVQALHGLILQNLGHIPEAEAKFRQALQTDPDNTHAFYALAHNQKITPKDADLVQRMERLSQKPDLSPAQRNYLAYALGKANQDLGNFQQAMAYYDQAHPPTAPFNRTAYKTAIDFAIEKFTPDFLKKHAACGIPSDLPIFVVGMMRSGTTLVEQILSSHSAVGAAGEQKFWMDHRAETFSNQGQILNESVVTQLATQYVDYLQTIAPGKPRVIDKMPVNYTLLGLIALALPNAKVIHVARNPVDTCISIYTTPNRSRLDWANNKADIVFAYRQYQRLMRHWETTLRPDQILHVSYEDLVLDREATTRQMVHFCGLEWEDACLQPEKNERVVLTPSVWQVRQPVYKSSLARWKNYEPWLGEFKELL